MVELTMVAEEVQMAQNGYLTTAEAAERLQTSTRNVTRWIRRGSFPGAFKINPDVENSPFLIPETAVIAFEERRRAGLEEE